MASSGVYHPRVVPFAVAATLVLGHVAPAETPDADLMARLRRIEAAFRQGDAPSLRTSFSSTTKVRLDLREVAEVQGSFGPGQLQVIFGQVFEASGTSEFAFPLQQVTLPSKETAFARGRWVLRSRPGGAQTVETLTFTLREEDGDWRILEIRSSR